MQLLLHVHPTNILFVLKELSRILANDILIFIPSHMICYTMQVSIQMSVHQSVSILSPKSKRSSSVLALREVWESETPKNCPGTSKNHCQEVWDSQFLKIFSHL